jgi:hypothetical protein
MGLHHPSDLFVGVVGIENVAHADAARRNIAEAKRVKEAEGRGRAGRERRQIDRPQAIDSLQDAFPQCDFLDVLVFDDLLVDREKPLFELEMVVEEFIFGPRVIELLDDVDRERNAKKSKRADENERRLRILWKDAETFSEPAKKSSASQR